MFAAPAEGQRLWLCATRLLGSVPSFELRPRAAYSPASPATSSSLGVATRGSAAGSRADPFPLLPPPLSQGEGQEGRDPSRHQVTEWPVARDLGAADRGEALNSHRGRGLGPGHTPAPVVSWGDSSAHPLAGQAPGRVGCSWGEGQA